MKLYAGLDWGASEHAVCVVDERGAVNKQFVVKHDADGLSELVRKLGAICENGVTIAIERPNGLLIDTLVDAGHTIVPMHPNAVAACRPRYRAAGGKSDPGDAYILADVLRTDGHRFRSLTPMSDEARALRAQVRIRDELVASCNRFRAPVASTPPRSQLNSATTRTALSRPTSWRPNPASHTHASGRSRGVAFRHACNQRLRRALMSFADNSRQASEWAAGIYERARGRGCRHPHAVRILARAWCRVLWRCWHDNVLYDPAKHGALVRAAA